MSLSFSAKVTAIKMSSREAVSSVGLCASCATRLTIESLLTLRNNQNNILCITLIVIEICYYWLLTIFSISS